MFTYRAAPERTFGSQAIPLVVQLDEVAERIVQEGLAPGAGDEWDPVHLDALLLQVGDGGIDVVDSDREVVRSERLGIGFHQVHLLATGVEPVPRAEIGARQLRHAEHIAIEGEALLRVSDADGDMVHTGRLHRSILTRSTFLHDVQDRQATFYDACPNDVSLDDPSVLGLWSQSGPPDDMTDSSAQRCHDVQVSGGRNAGALDGPSRGDGASVHELRERSR